MVCPCWKCSVPLSARAGRRCHTSTSVPREIQWCGEEGEASVWVARDGWSLCLIVACALSFLLLLLLPPSGSCPGVSVTWPLITLIRRKLNGNCIGWPSWVLMICVVMRGDGRASIPWAMPVPPMQPQQPPLPLQGRHELDNSMLNRRRSESRSNIHLSLNGAPTFQVSTLPYRCVKIRVVVRNDPYLWCFADATRMAWELWGIGLGQHPTTR
jgi:hypothetical protein